jgi:hypothetical protein
MQRVHGFLQAPAFFPGAAKSIMFVMNAYRRVSLILTLVVPFLASPVHAQQTIAPQATHYPIPAKGKIPVAFVITDDAVTIDFAGPWEVFKDVFVKDRGKTMAEQAAFRLLHGIRFAAVLGDAGVLKNRKATTHHLFYEEFQAAFPDVLLQKNKRFVQSSPVIFTAGGLSSGIDLALHIVQLYFGPSQAEETAHLMEYEGTDWKGDGSATGSAPESAKRE